MKLLFWNVQRLGRSTPNLRGGVVEGVVAHAFQDHHVDLVVLCEMSGSTHLGDVAVNKQLNVIRRGATRGAAQLGYAAISDDLNEVAIQRFELPSFSDTFGRPIHRKGGNAFTRHTKRFVGHLGDFAGVNVYVYHANASAKGAFLVAWVAAALDLEDDGDFLLVGDLNSTPQAVRTQMQFVGLDPDTFEFGWDQPTHNAHKPPATKVYDWAIGGFSIVPGVTTLDIGGFVQGAFGADAPANMPDHLPIVVEI